MDGFLTSGLDRVDLVTEGAATVDGLGEVVAARSFPLVVLHVENSGHHMSTTLVVLVKMLFLVMIIVKFFWIIFDFVVVFMNLASLFDSAREVMAIGTALLMPLELKEILAALASFQVASGFGAE